jgi:hypothetical protein
MHGGDPHGHASSFRHRHENNITADFQAVVIADLARRHVKLVAPRWIRLLTVFERQLERAREIFASFDCRKLFIKKQNKLAVALYLLQRGGLHFNHNAIGRHVDIFHAINWPSGRKITRQGDGQYSPVSLSA